MTKSCDAKLGKLDGPIRAAGLAVVLMIPCLSSTVVWGQAKGKVEIDFYTPDADDPLTVRVQLLEASGRAIRARGAKFVRGWNLIEGRLIYAGKPGDYRYRVHHGPQFSAASGGFTLDEHSEGVDVVELPRHCDLAAEGWRSADLLTFLPAKQTLPWLAAEDLDLAVQVTSSPAGSILPATAAAIPAVETLSYHDNRPGSGLTIHHWAPPEQVPLWVPSSQLIVMAKKQQANNPQASGLPVHVEVQRPWARDLPIWLASGRIDSIQILGEHLTHDGEGAGRVTPPQSLFDAARFRGSRGPGRFVEQVYWNILDSGLRVAPSAGSGYGRNSAILGYNRVYVSPSYPDRKSWWDGLKQGRSFVTNGPLLRTTVNGQLPGSTLSFSGEHLALELSTTLTVSDPVEYLDVIFNGRSLYQVRLEEHRQRGGRIPTLSVSDSGWLLVRVLTERDHTYRLATTAPFYVEARGEPRISRSAVEYFQRWLDAAEREMDTGQEQAKTAAAPYLRAARQFWSDQLQRANAD